MSADNRSTHTDALATLGTIINKDEKRDAIHLGVEPVQAGEQLCAGEHVGIGPDGKAYGSYFGCEEGNANYPKAIGIVDPFLDQTIYKGQWFWLIVYPRQITSLRHVWEHPDFKVSGETEIQTVMNEPTEEQLHKMNLMLKEPKAMAKQVMMDVATGLGVSFDELIDHANDYAMTGKYWSEGGRFEGESLPNTFWPAYETYFHTLVGNTGNFLSCSC